MKDSGESQHDVITELPDLREMPLEDLRPDDKELAVTLRRIVPGAGSVERVLVAPFNSLV